MSLFLLGLFFSFVSTSIIASDKLGTNSYYFFLKHFVFICVGISLLFLISFIERDKLIYVSLILFITITLDQLTKYIAFIVLFKDQQVLIINHYLNFRPVWNDGISFGMLQGYGNLGRVIFIIIALIISLWIVIYSKKLNTIGFVGYNMIAGGAIGNVIDRVIHGKVIDFIDLHYKAYHWPAFNMADSFIFIGVLLFLYNELIVIRGKKNV